VFLEPRRFCSFDRRSSWMSSAFLYFRAQAMKCRLVRNLDCARK
jgi:hypothetical protein